MIVTFCGHSDFQETAEYEQKVLAFLEETVGEQPAEMFLGGYGVFDFFAYRCCKKYQKEHPNIKLVFVTPYMNETYQRNRLNAEQEKYDLTIYPEIENKPLRFAILYRNRFMVEKADYVVAYITREWGGAFQTYKYAKRKGKSIFCLSEFDK